ncbi:hypothetical protein Ahy_A09g043848 [Arachis hypogaea]|uniref:Uncharacterized protein n=1 Tax=Arachis hypogaea TaxID=3818 RepID=A0A445BJ37_ARAHY|nr:hypothetical protein Ahy_A09g043848 [Arachis hypogaea]
MEVELKQLMADLQSLNQSLPDPSLHASLLKIILRVGHLASLGKSEPVRHSKVKDVCLSSTRVALEFYRAAREAILLY